MSRLALTVLGAVCFTDCGASRTVVSAPAQPPARAERPSDAHARGAAQDCDARVLRSNEEAPELYVAERWIDVCRGENQVLAQEYVCKRQHWSDRPPATEDEAKERFCDGQCEGDPPWRILRQVNSTVSFLEQFVWPLQSGPIAVYGTTVSGRSGVGPAFMCVPNEDLQVRVSDGIVRVTATTTTFEQEATDLPLEEINENNPDACREAKTTVQDTFVDVAARRKVLTVTRTTMPGDSTASTVSMTGRTVMIEGGGCQERVVLGAGPP